MYTGPVRLEAPKADSLYKGGLSDGPGKTPQSPSLPEKKIEKRSKFHLLS